MVRSPSNKRVRKTKDPRAPVLKRADPRRRSHKVKQVHYLNNLSMYRPPAGYNHKGQVRQIVKPNGAAERSIQKITSKQIDVILPKSCTKRTNGFLLFVRHFCTQRQKEAQKEGDSQDNSREKDGAWHITAHRESTKMAKLAFDALTGPERAVWYAKAALHRERYREHLNSKNPIREDADAPLWGQTRVLKAGHRFKSTKKKAFTTYTLERYAELKQEEDNNTNDATGKKLSMGDSTSATQDVGTNTGDNSQKFKSKKMNPLSVAMKEWAALNEEEKSQWKEKAEIRTKKVKEEAELEGQRREKEDAVRLRALEDEEFSMDVFDIYREAGEL